MWVTPLVLLGPTQAKGRLEWGTRFPPKARTRLSSPSCGVNDKEGYMPREIVTLQCGECKDRNYSTTKNKKTTTGRLEFSKFCRKCRKHTPHKEAK